jgi:hypothetical protein
LLTLLPASTEAAVATQRQLARGSDPQTEAGARTAATLGCQVLDSCVCGSPACVDAVLSCAVAAGPPLLDPKAYIDDEHWGSMLELVRADLLQLEPNQRCNCGALLCSN